MKKTVNRIQIELELNGQGLVNYNGDKVPVRFINDMKVNGKTTTNGSFAKENIYKEVIKLEDGTKKEVFIPKKIISSNLLRKCILGDENDVNADKLATNDKLRVAYLSQDNVIARGYCILGRTSIDIKRKSAFTVTDAEQTSNTITWLETKTSEGERNENSLFFKETCGEIEYKSRIFVDVKQLQFISVDDNYDRLSIPETDVNAFVSNIEKRYGKNSATYGNWATTNTNVIGEQGIVLSNKVVSNIVRETIKKLLAVDIKRAGSFAKTKSLRISLGFNNEVLDLNASPKFVEIKSIEDYDKLMSNVEIGIEFAPVEAPVIEKIEKRAKKTKENE